MNMTVPRSPLNDAPMRPWLDVPGDWRRPDVHDSYALFWEDALKFGALWPRPEPHEIPGFYAIPYYTHADPANIEAASWTMGQRLAMAVAWRLDPGEDLDSEWVARHACAPPKSVCDLGCGDGGLLADLKTTGYAVTGVEPDPLARRAAAARGLDVLDGTAETLPPALAKEKHDVLILSHVLEHCLHPMQALQNVRALLRDGGCAIIETPNNICAGLKQAGIYWPWLDVPRHLNFFTAQSLCWACEQSGLAVESVHYRGYARHFNPDWLQQEGAIRKALGAPTSRVTDSQLLRRLAATLALPASRKCDSVRLLCRAR